MSDEFEGGRNLFGKYLACCLLTSKYGNKKDKFCDVSVIPIARFSHTKFLNLFFPAAEAI